MTLVLSRTAFVGSVTGLAVGVLAFWLSLQPLQPLDRLVYDLWVLLAASARTVQREWDVAVVGIDKKAAGALLGPGDRQIRRPLTQALSRLRELGVDTVAVDVILSDAGDPKLDDELFQEIHRFPKGKVVLACRMVFGQDRRSFQLQLPYRRFRDAGAGFGYADVVEDADSAVRRVQLAGKAATIESSGSSAPGSPPLPSLVSDQHAHVEYLALAAARAYRGWPAPRLTPSGWEGHSPEGTVLYRARTLPGEAISLVPFRRVPGRLGSLEAIALSQLLNPGVEAARYRVQLKGKLVVLGATYPECKDELKTPFSSIFGPSLVMESNVLTRDFEVLRHRSYGVEIVANCAQAALDSAFPTVLASGPHMACVGGVGVIFGAMSQALSIEAWSLRALIGGTSLALASLFAFLRFELFVSPVPMLLALALLAIVRIWAQAIREGLRKDYLQRTLSRYVSREICEAILANPELLRLPAQRVEVTVLFCDLRGFTSRSEGLKPSEVLSLIDEFLQAMASAVVEQGGVVNKFLGDGLMAFWGAPFPAPDHAARACRTGFLMLDRLAELNRRLRKTSSDLLEMGIGINSGPAVVGTVGYAERLEYTLVGDAVNVASRLQELTKVYGRPLIVGELTQAACLDQLLFRRLDRVRVRGRHEPITVFEAIREADPWMAAYEEGLAAYLDGRFQQAVSGFSRVNELAPDDVPTKLLLARSRSLQETAPDSWDGCSSS